MEMTKLCDSWLCRLCAEENKNVTFLFSQEDNSENLSLLINKYLPIKVENDKKFPVNICPGCHIQLEATKLFMDLIVQGQSKLRDLYRQQQDKLAKQEKQRQQLEKALQSVNPKSTIQTYTVQTDESGVLQSFIQIFSDGPLFPPEHQLSLQAAGLEKPKRKRGRPQKQTVDSIINSENKNENEKELLQEIVKKNEEEEVLDTDGRRRRKIRPPLKYEGVLQGDELEKMLEEEGIEEKIINEKTELIEEDLIIGRIQSDNGKDTGEPVYGSKRYLKNFGFKPAKPKTVYQCDCCKRDFVHFGRYQLHMNVVHKTEVHKKPKFNEDKDSLSPQTPGVTVVAVSQELDTNGELQLDPSIDEISENEINKQPYNCDKCNKIYVSAKTLEIHKLTHLEEPPNLENEASKQLFGCDMCSKTFNYRTSLLYHKKTKHNTGRKFVCNKCPKTFKLQQQLQRHQQVHSEDRPFGCSKCTMTFKTKSNLINHLVVHSGEKKFCCNLCGQRYTHSTSLKLHMRWHEGKKPFQCDVCFKAFSQKGNLTEHMRIHTGEKPYCCDHCGKSFTTSSQFHLHLKRHTGDKPFVCNYCSKSFLNRVGYIVHVRRHMNERPFKCTICKRSFPEPWSLKRHQRIHSQEKPYTCPICFKTFSDSSNKLKHISRLNHTKSHMNVVEDPYENMIVTLVNDSAVENKSEDGELIELVTTTDPSEKEDNNENSKLQLTQLIDSQGNPISITTSDGQTIPVVTDDDENCIKGLLPDGTLIPIDLDKELAKDDTIPNLLNLKEGLSLNDPELLQTEEEQTLDTSIQNIQFMTGQDGQEMCLVTYSSLDSNDTVINQDLQSALFLTPT